MRFFILLLFSIPVSIIAQEALEIEVYSENQLFGIQHKNGKKITTAIYDERPFIDKYSKVCHVTKNHKIGFVNFSGKEITPLIYDEVGFFSGKNGLCSVTKDEKYGFIDINGKMIIPLIYESTDLFFVNGICSAYINEKVGLIDEKGKVIVPFEYDEMGDLDEDRALFQVKKEDAWGYMNYKGEIIIPIMYQMALYFNEGKALVFNGEVFYYINDANQKMSQDYIFVAVLSDYLYILENHDKTEFYLFDESKDDIRTETYQAIYGFSEEMAIVKKGGKFGYIDSLGDLVIPCEFDYAQAFSQGKAQVRKGTDKFTIDVTGKPIR